MTTGTTVTRATEWVVASPPPPPPLKIITALPSYNKAANYTHKLPTKWTRKTFLLMRQTLSTQVCLAFLPVPFPSCCPYVGGSVLCRSSKSYWLYSWSMHAIQQYMHSSTTTNSSPTLFKPLLRPGFFSTETVAWQKHNTKKPHLPPP